MSKPNKDVKFIIYQVLYIFIIVVLTMKGADIDLTKVIDINKVVEKTYSDSLKAYIDSLTALGLVPRVEFDSARREDYKIQPISVIQGIVLQEGQMIISKKDFTGIQQPIITETKTQDQQIELKIVQPTQYTVNSIKNSNAEPLQIYADNSLIQTIPANSSGSYQLKNQSIVKYVCGGTSKQVETLPNQIQKISFQSFSAGSADKKLRELQSVIGWRITVEDDFVDQIDIKVTGPVKAKQVGKGIIDVQLQVCGSKDQFDKMFGDRDAPYTVTFNVVATDKISGKVVSRQGSFIFGEW